MIKTLMAHTMEIDEIDLAVEEILEQLDIESNLLTHSAGIVSCYPEFLETGVFKAVCDALPFDVVGTTTFANADADAADQMMLSLIVLTSDDLEFSTVYSDSISDEQEAPLAKAYRQGLACLSGKPSMMISFLPLLFHVGGDLILEALNRVTDNLPNFGTIVVDHNEDYHSAYTLINGEYAKDRLVMLLIAGDISPKFFITSISERMTFDQQATITASKGNLLMEVNNISALEYMESMGLARDGHINGLNSIPYMVNFNDGTPSIARAIFAQTPEGYMVCGGDMPVNATLSIASIDYADVMRTSADIVQTALEAGKHQGMLIYSCVGRNLALGIDTLAEMELIQQKIGNIIPYQFTYSGGEVCPVYDANGKLINRFHNNTLVICVF